MVCVVLSVTVLRVMLGRVRDELTGQRKIHGEECPPCSVKQRRCPADFPASHVAAPRLRIYVGCRSMRMRDAAVC